MINFLLKYTFFLGHVVVSFRSVVLILFLLTFRFHLSQRPDVVQKILQEMDSVVGDRDLQYDDLKSLKYILQTESMRQWFLKNLCKT